MENIRDLLGHRKFDANVLDYMKALLCKNSNSAGLLHEKMIANLEALLSDDISVKSGTFLKQVQSLLTVFNNQFSIIHSVFNSYEYISRLLRKKHCETFWIYVRLYCALFKKADFDFSNIAFIHCDFSGLDLSGVDMSNCQFDECCFDNTNLSGATLRQSSMRGVSLRDAIMKDADLSYADLSKSDLRGTNLKRSYCISTNFQYADLKDSSLVGAYCGHANFTLANLRSADCSNCNFENSYFYKTNLLNTILDGAEYKDAVLEEVYIMK